MRQSLVPPSSKAKRMLPLHAACALPAHSHKTLQRADTNVPMAIRSARQHSIFVGSETFDIALVTKNGVNMHKALRMAFNH